MTSAVVVLPRTTQEAIVVNLHNLAWSLVNPIRPAPEQSG
jgi:hypothetical protein